VTCAIASDPRPDDAIRDAQRGGAGRGGAAQDVAGNVPLGYDASERTLIINPAEAETVRHIFAFYRDLGCVRQVKDEELRHRYGASDRLGRSAEHPCGHRAAHSSGRSPVQLVNLANIAAYVVARIVLVQL
jgi:hypothetical protein